MGFHGNFVGTLNFVGMNTFMGILGISIFRIPESQADQELLMK